MRIHFLASTLVRGGAETMAAALSRGLMHRGHIVEWFLLREPGLLGEALKKDMRVHTDLVPTKLDWFRIRKIAKLMKGAEGLYVLDHDNAAVVGSLAARFAQVPKRFLGIHTTGRWGGGRSLGRIMRMTLPAYTSVLALSQAHQEYLVNREGLQSCNIRILPNGIDLADFKELPTKETMRKELGLPQHAVILGSVAMLRPEKNHALLLSVAKDLNQNTQELHVVLVGNGPEREALERQAQELNLRGRVHFLGRRDDAPRVLKAFDVFVLTSHPLVETQPLAVLEAMAAGIPVVASQVGDLTALLQGGVGELVDPGDRGGFVEAIGRVLGAPEYESTLRRKGLERIQEYSLERSLDTFERIMAEEGR